MRAGFTASDASSLSPFRCFSSGFMETKQGVWDREGRVIASQAQALVEGLIIIA